MNERGREGGRRECNVSQRRESKGEWECKWRNGVVRVKERRYHHDIDSSWVANVRV